MKGSVYSHEQNYSSSRILTWDLVIQLEKLKKKKYYYDPHPLPSPTSTAGPYHHPTICTSEGVQIVMVNMVYCIYPKYWDTLTPYHTRPII